MIYYSRFQQKKGMKFIKEKMASSRQRGVLGQSQINKKYALNKLNKIQQTFPSFPHKLKLFPAAKPNTPQICQLILADDELFEFV